MELNVNEALRYLGAGEGADEALRERVEGQAARLTALVRPRYWYRVTPVTHGAQGILLAEAGLFLTGRTAALMLEECGQAVLLACTLGAQFDALLRTEQARDMAQAVILDACGSAWVEAGCDRAEEEIAGRFPGKYLTDRFSPGYGDLPLTVQPELCRALDAQRRLGLCVTPSLLLTPGKSVTAVLGIADRPQRRRVRGCACCSMKQTCTLRKRGMTCGI